MSTLDYYRSHADAFISDSINSDVSSLYAHFLPMLPDGAAVLDLGCGSGRDSLYFQNQGYRVTAVDGTEEFCRQTEKLLGKPVECLRFENLYFQNRFDGIWACASLLHVPKESIHEILNRVSEALKPGGVLYMSFKYGTSERESGGRFFSDYTEDKIPWLLSGTVLECTEYWISDDVRPGRADEKWLNILCRKPEQGSVLLQEETLRRIRKFTEDRDWDQFHTPANLAKSISIEANELLECFQWNEENYSLGEVSEELADVLVYCVNLLDRLGLDADDIIRRKMRKNEEKYPVEKARGNSAKYNRL